MTFFQMLFSFKGRLNRANFWLMRFLVVFSPILIGLIMSMVGESAINIILLPMIILYFWSSLAIEVKRWHDRNKSAWWLLTWLIPIVGVIWAFIELGCLKGTKGYNRFGPDPLK